MIRAAIGASERASVLLFGAFLAASFAGCSNAPEGQSESVISSSVVEAGAVSGELVAVSILGSPEGTDSEAYYLHPSNGSPDLKLSFDANPNLTSQTQIRVWGQNDGAELHVTHFELIEPPANVSELIGQPSTTQTVAWVQMDVNGGGVTQTVAQANALIFDTTAAGPLFGTKAGQKSVVQYYDENSYGMLKLTGQVEGPIPFTGTACNNFDPLAQDVVAKVTALGRTYQHYYLYWGTLQPCGPGWGDQGTRNKPGKYVWLNQNGTFCTATGQEIGHNFGLMHASTMDCGTATLSNDTSTCTSNEYGNPMTVMGGGCGHLMSVEKWYSGFFQGCNAIKVKSTNTFTVLPIEIPCNGIQALQIPMPASAPVRTTTTDQSNGNVTVKFYYLELRGGQGMDTGMKTGVYVHVAADIPGPSSNGVRTFLLDMNPATDAFDAMSVGQTFTDPAGGVSFTLNSVSTSKASISVTIDGGTAANTCVDGSTLTGAGPDSCSSGGGTGGVGGAGAGGAAGAGAGGAGAGGAAGAGAGGSSAGGSNAGGAGGASAGGTHAGGASTGGSSAGGVAGAGGAAAGSSSSGAGGLAGASGAGAAGLGGTASGGQANAGAGGSAGPPAASGSSGLSGSAGASVAGSSPGVPGPASTEKPSSSSDKAGCSCELARQNGGNRSPARAPLLLLAAVGALVRRRRALKPA